MMNEFTHDPTPDPDLVEALRASDQRSVTEADWDSLRQSIRERAELPLARQRRQHRGARTVRWLQPIIPAAAAASLALVVGVQLIGPAPQPQLAGASSELLLRPMVEEVLGMEISEPEFDLLFGGADTDALLLAAAGSR